MKRATPALYVGTLRHRRFEPAWHSFRTELFLAYLDVDAVADSLAQLPGWSARRPAPVWFRRRDYFDGTDRPLGDGLRELVASRTGRAPLGPIYLLTHLRTAGWLFNPLSVYFCFAADGHDLESIVLEVTNTPRHDRCWYVVDLRGDPTGPWEFAKTMPVSPFLAPDLTYRLRCSHPGDLLTIRLEDLRDGHKIFDADLSLRRVPLTRRTAVLMPLRHPFLTWRITAAIYSHAARLWRKGVPIHPRERQPPTTRGKAA